MTKVLSIEQTESKRPSTERPLSASSGSEDEKASLEAPADVSGAATLTEALESRLPARTKKQKRKENWHFFSVCFVLFLAGWDGGTLGPLILRIQTYYNVCVHDRKLQPVLEIISSGKLHSGFSDLHHELYSKCNIKIILSI